MRNFKKILATVALAVAPFVALGPAVQAAPLGAVASAVIADETKTSTTIEKVRYGSRRGFRHRGFHRFGRFHKFGKFRSRGFKRGFRSHRYGLRHGGFYSGYGHGFRGRGYGRFH
ncbi:MAG: hypothetical protein AAFO75_07680 [Pseudomonadota bacterium]